jgi:transposase
MTSKGREEMDKATIGIDVSKDHLNAHRLPDGAVRQFANTRSGLTRLLRWIGCGSSVDRVVFEPTGRYHLELERRMDTAGLPVVKVNPRQAKRFAQSLGCAQKLTERMRRCWRAWERHWRWSHSR